MRLTVNVTREHIDTGACGAPMRCAIAKALRDLLEGVLVDGDTATWSVEGKYYSAELPGVAKLFIRKFDETRIEGRKALQPFSFDIELPAAYVDSIDISGITEMLKKVPHLKLEEVCI